MHGAVLQLRYMAIQAISLCNNNLLEIKGYESRLQKNNVLPGRHQILYMCCSLLDLQDLEPANCTSRDTTLLQALVSSIDDAPHGHPCCVQGSGGLSQRHP